MRLERLTKEQIAWLYRERMTFDFPADELKPLEMIFIAIDKGIYEVLGLYEELRPMGYVTLVKKEGDYLIDYLATWPEVRNRGAGAEMIALLAEYLKDAGSIIGEVEDPEFAMDEEESRLRSRRIAFYHRNGFRDCNVKVQCFGVHFNIIEMGAGLVHSESEIIKLYKMHYKMMLPPEMYEKNIIICQE